ncbi:MAG: MrtC family glutamic-type intramembrane protease [Polyangiales bacterium]
MSDSAPSRKLARRHLAIACVAVNALVFVLSRPALMARGLHDLIGVVFLGGAMLGIRYDDDDTTRYGVKLEGIFPGAAGDRRSLVRTLWEALPSALRELGVAGAVALVVLPIYSAVWPLVNRPIGPRHFALDADRWREFATELLAVAFTEEMFFRGYVYTRVSDALGLPPTLSARDAARVIVVTAVLFSLTHVIVDPTAARAAVFFPALLFGAMRYWRGGIGAAVALHATCNLWERYLEGR